MYDQFDQYVDRYLITVVDKTVQNGDAFFDLSIIDNSKDWLVNRVTSRTQGPDDEAAFEIFELIARDSDRRRSMREVGIAPHTNRVANKLGRQHNEDHNYNIPLTFDLQ